jgi:putative membrane protein
LPGQIRDAFYSGQVALVTYVVATGLGLVGVFAGAIGATARPDAGGFVQGLTFLYQGVPWLTVAALTASLGRLLDELIHDDDEIHAAYLNLPFGAIAVGLVVRGFSAYFLERAGSIRPARIPPLDLGPLLVEGVSLAAGTRLAAFIVAGVLVSLVGVQFTTYVTDRTVEESVLDQSRDS